MAAGPYFLLGNNIGCVLIHGFGSSAGEMAGLGNYLHQQGYTVYGVLLRGHGTSPEDMAQTRWPDWYASVTEAIEELRQSCSEVWAAGLSLGGSLSLYAASQGLVDGVISLAAPSGLADWRAKFAGLGKYFMPYQHKKITPEQREFDQRWRGLVYDRLPLAAIESLYKFIGIAKKNLPFIKAPILVVHSAKDEVIAAESGAYIYHTVASLEKEFVQLKRSRHIITEDVEKELVYQKVAAFVQKHTSLHD